MTNLNSRETQGDQGCDPVKNVTIHVMSHAASARDAKRPLPENSNFLAPQICPIVLFGVDPVFSVTTSTVPRPLQLPSKAYSFKTNQVAGEIRRLLSMDVHCSSASKAPKDVKITDVIQQVPLYLPRSTLEQSIKTIPAFVNGIYNEFYSPVLNSNCTQNKSLLFTVVFRLINQTHSICTRNRLSNQLTTTFRNTNIALYKAPVDDL